MNTSDLTTDYNSRFAERLSKLNPEQRKAVESIEGPVLVLAGPGTGKTEIIALRIANIIKQTQLGADSILCLTFTDAAVNEMRSRLAGLIGPEASKVGIYTFHSFCVQVINEYPYHFSSIDSVSGIVNEITKYEIIRAIIASLPAGDPYKPVRSPYLHARDFLDVIDKLKQEQIDVKTLGQTISSLDDLIKDIRGELEALISTHAKSLKRDNFVELHNHIQKNADPANPIIKKLTDTINEYLNRDFESEKMAKKAVTALKKSIRAIYEKHLSPKALSKFRSLLYVYQQYDKQFSERGLYDFNDMINMVVKAFAENEELTQIYQEKFQYLLIDEYQDTNNAQNNVVVSLTKFFESPNVFAVGDDDQSIFRFQGASLENIINFQDSFGESAIIALVRNYRSQKHILSSATAVISNNSERASNVFKGKVDKNLIPANPDRKEEPIIHKSYDTEIEEIYGVVKDIKLLAESGTELEDIAVIVRNNKHITKMAEVLGKHDIAYKIDKGDNILADKFIKGILTLLAFISDPLSDARLYQILCLPFFRLSAKDLVNLIRYSSKQQVSIWELLSDSAKLSLADVTEVERLINISNYLSELIKHSQVETASEIIKKLMQGSDSEIIAYLKEQKDSMQKLIHLYRFAKELESLALNNPNYMLSNFVQQMNLYQEYGITINEKTLGAKDNAIQLTTAHSSKGHEYDHVFIMNLVKNVWEKDQKAANVQVPFGIIKNQQLRNDLDEQRRLFFVALTRARKKVYLSSHKYSLADKEQTLARFVMEIPEILIAYSDETSDPNELKELLSTEMLRGSRNIVNSENKVFIRRLIENYRLSPTDIIAYKKSPRRFFFEKILRIPIDFDASENIVFGNCVHKVMHMAVNYLKKQGSLPSWEYLLQVYKNELYKSRLDIAGKEELFDHGSKRLEHFWKKEKDLLVPVSLTEYSFSKFDIEINGVPLTGKIDRMDYIDANRTTAKVVDYKTSSPDNLSGKISEKNKTGEYVDQLKFYKLLIESSNLNTKVESTCIKFIDEDKNGQFKEVSFTFTEEEMSKFASEIKEVYQKIINLEFDNPGDMKDEWYADFPLPI